MIERVLISDRSSGLTRKTVEWAKGEAENYKIKFTEYDTADESFSIHPQEEMDIVSIFEDAMERGLESQEPLATKPATQLVYLDSYFWKVFSAAKQGRVSMELYRDLGPPQAHATLQVLFEEGMIGFELYFGRSIEPFCQDLLEIAPQRAIHCLNYFAHQAQHQASSCVHNAEGGTGCSSVTFCEELMPGIFQENTSFQISCDFINRSVVRLSLQPKWHILSSSSRQKIVDELFELAISCKSSSQCY